MTDVCGQASNSGLRSVAGLAAAALTVSLLGAGAATAAEVPVASKVPHGLEGVPVDGPATGLQFAQFKGQVYMTGRASGQLWRWKQGAVPQRVTRASNKVTQVMDPVAVGDWLYFVARDSARRIQVYRTNGVPGNVLQVSHFEGRYDDVGSVKGIGNSVYFKTWDLDGETTWRTAGGAPQQVRDDYANEADMYRVGNRRLFLGVPPQRPSGIYATDGTEAGTVALALGDPGVRGLAAVTSGNLLYFMMPAPSMANALWVSDGTPAGTRVVRQLPAPPSSGDAGFSLTAVQGGVVLVLPGSNGTHEIWHSSGTAAGTRRMKSVVGGVRLEGVLGANVFHITSGSRDLWKLDTTTGVTTQLTWFGQDSGVESRTLGGGGATVALGRLFFLARDPLHGFELWSTDGGPASMVKELSAGPATTRVRNLTAVGNSVLFTAGPERQKAGTLPKPKLWRITNGADREVVAPALVAAGRQRQGSSVKLVIKLGAGERFSGRVRGTVKVGNKLIALPRQSVTSQAGQVRVVTVTLKGAAGRKVLRAVKAWRAAPKSAKKQRLVRATPKVVFVDAAGKRATRTVSVSLT